MLEIRVEIEARLQTWTLDGEARRNALSRGLVAELRRLLARIPAMTPEERPGVVILTGAGDRAFCAGADLKERAGMSVEEVRAFLRSLNQALLELEECDAVFIAALNGAALGGGLELALACDLRIAAPHVELALPEVGLGIIPGAGGTQRLPRLIGAARAKRLILTGRRVNASDALAAGLIDGVASPGELHKDARALAHDILKNAPLAVSAAKRAVNEGLSLPLPSGLERERHHYEVTLSSEDRLEGLRAFSEKRPPHYRGR